MTLAKALKCHPELRRSEGSPAVSKGDGFGPSQNSGPHHDKIGDPIALLEDLKTKQRQYQTLKNQGLILQDHREMETKLKETILELEALLPQLEKSNV